MFTPDIFKRKTSGQWLSLLLLGTLMGLTRYHHFGDSFHVPDASWATFFLGGLLIQDWRYFLVLCALAFGIDAFALQSDVSSFCVTPAYGFLIPTHAVLWFAGRKANSLNTLQMTLLCFGATLIAFLISDLSFFALSDSFAEQSLIAHLKISLQYLGHYLLITLGYSLTGFVVYRLFTRNIAAASMARSTVSISQKFTTFP